jgi:hypothetical protein
VKGEPEPIPGRQRTQRGFRATEDPRHEREGHARVEPHVIHWVHWYLLTSPILP